MVDKKQIDKKIESHKTVLTQFTVYVIALLETTPNTIIWLYDIINDASTIGWADNLINNRTKSRERAN